MSTKDKSVNSLEVWFRMRDKRAIVEPAAALHESVADERRILPALRPSIADRLRTRSICPRLSVEMLAGHRNDAAA